MSTSDNASRNRRVMSSSAWLASATPDGWLCAKISAAAVSQRLPHDFPRMHAGSIDGAAEHFLEVDEPVAIVEVQAAENLVLPVAQLCREELARGGGRVHRGTSAQRLAVVTPGNLE